MGFLRSLGESFGLVKPKVQAFGGPSPTKTIKSTPEGRQFIGSLQERIAGREGVISDPSFNRIISPIKTQAEGTSPLLKPLQERIAGIGVGFDPEVLSASTSPFAKARRAAVTEVEAPRIAAEASARGLGRSTIPVAQIARAGTLAERDIGERIAQLSLANEEQKRSEINNAFTNLLNLQVDATSQVFQSEMNRELNKIINKNNANAALGQIAQSEADTLNDSAKFEFQKFQNEVVQRQGASQVQREGIGRLLSLGSAAFGGATSGGAGSAGAGGGAVAGIPG